MLMVFKANGEISQLKPKDKKVSLEELQKVVGGYVEILPMGNKFVICDEEGKLKNSPLNEKVSTIFQEFWKTEEVLLGDIILADHCDIYKLGE